MTKRSEKIEAPLAIRGVEMQQRAENGGWPLPNETAGALDLGHGTSLLVVSQRSLVQYLHRAARNFVSGSEALADTRAMLREWDHFALRDGLDDQPVIGQPPLVVEYRQGLPPLEAIEAHEARGAWWQWRFEDEVPQMVAMRVFAGEIVRMNKSTAGPSAGWFDPPREHWSPEGNRFTRENLRAADATQWAYRPALADGTPVPWLDALAAQPVLAPARSADSRDEKKPNQMSIEELRDALRTERNVAFVYQVIGPLSSAPERSVTAARCIADYEAELRRRGESIDS